MALETDAPSVLAAIYTVGMRSSCAVIAVATAMSGCGFHSPSLSSDIDVDTGRDIDAGPPDACLTFSGQLDTCALAFSGDLLISESATYNTDDHSLRTQSNATIAVSTVALHTLGDDVDAIYARSIRLATGVQLRATGSKGLALLALDRIVLDAGAVIDVSAGGAGARSSCEKAAKAGENNNGGAAGGGGGGYGAAGGDGGNGNSDGTFGVQSKGGAKGDATADVPAGPRGGCPGAKGGNGSDPGGAGGLAGGAIFLAAGVRIELAGSAGINAGGGGGGGGMRNDGHDGDGGGGGGASGGYILVEAPRVLGPAATLAANGGGGGEGSGDAKAGNDGTSGLLSDARAPGGANNSPTGTDGALGGSAPTTIGDHPSSVDKGGGGGGGGGVGFVRVASPDAQLGVLSPAGR